MTSDLLSRNLLQFLDSLKHSPLSNYGGIPGLTSWIIQRNDDGGLVRLMECSRDHQEPIIPHSHRFDFNCLVLAGKVVNVLWSDHGGHAFSRGDEYISSTMTYGGQPGQYEKVLGTVSKWSRSFAEYKAGDEYSMTADKVHSIFFSRGAVVLFFEGPPVSDKSIILEPFVDGEVVPTFSVQPWAFKKGGAL